VDSRPVPDLLGGDGLSEVEPNALETAKASGWKATSMKRPKVESEASAIRRPTEPNFDRIPDELKRLAQWVNYRQEERGGKSTKVPYQARAPTVRASSTDPATWGTFEEAREAYEKYASEAWREHGIEPVSGIGFTFTRESRIVGIDFDHCRDRATGEWDADVLKLVLALGSYTEISPSGEGLHVFAFGALPGPSKKKGNLEIYDSGRFFTVTGAHLDGTPTAVKEAAPGTIEALYAIIAGEPDPTPRAPRASTRGETPTDEEVLKRCRKATNHDKFERLWGGDTSGYPSASEADLALCNILAFQSGGDYGTVDRLFKRSGLYRPKWDERPGRTSYGERTITKAISETLIPQVGSRTATGEARAHDPADAICKDFHLTDLGNSERLLHRFGRDLQYCHPHRSWYRWNGRQWLVDRFNQAPKYAKATARRIYDEAAAEQNENRQGDLRKHARLSEGERAVRAMLALASSEVSIPPELLDGDPNLLNLQNGTLELDTLTVREHRREDLCTKVAGVSYDPAAKCPKFEGHLSKIFGGNGAFIDSLQELLGYALLSGNPWRYFPIFHGRGANGKSVLLAVLRAVLGDYAVTAAPSTFMQQENDGRPRPDLLALKGARLVTATETEDSKRLAEATVKAMTGGDEMSCRGLYKDNESFLPSHLAILASNYMPTVRGQDQGIWDRLLRIPFEVTIPVAERIPGYEQELIAEGSGVLNWLLEGLRRYYENGNRVTIHPRMVDATKRYREDMDFLRPFMLEFCVREPDAKCTKTQLYQRYKEWCEQNGERPMSKQKLRTALLDRDFEEDRNMSARVWLGIRLKTPDELNKEILEASRQDQLP
jgi:putative DNA primase/helicase